VSADVLFAVDVIARDGGIRARCYSSRNMRRKKFVKQRNYAKLGLTHYVTILCHYTGV